MQPTRRSLCALLFLFVLSLLVVPPALTQGGGNNPGVIPPHAKYRGLTYGEWQARYWQELFDVPVVNGEHPFLTFGAFGGKDGVVFLAPSYGQPGTTVVDVTVPAGTPLFFPIMTNAECSEFEPDPFHGDDEASLRACANSWYANTKDYYAFVDGRAVQNIEQYRGDSPLYTLGPLPADNILAFFGLGTPEGATALSVSAGYHLLLAPLSVGQHEVRVGTTWLNGNPNGETAETVFRITVVSNKK